MGMSAVAARSLRILVAEDDPALSKLYASYAESRGHAVVFARDGAEALVAAATERPDVILLDVAMPRARRARRAQGRSRRARAPADPGARHHRLRRRSVACATSCSSSAPGM